MVLEISHLFSLSRFCCCSPCFSCPLWPFYFRWLINRSISGGLSRKLRAKPWTWKVHVLFVSFWANPINVIPCERMYTLKADNTEFKPGLWHFLAKADKDPIPYISQTHRHSPYLMHNFLLCKWGWEKYHTPLRIQWGQVSKVPGKIVTFLSFCPELPLH